MNKLSLKSKQIENEVLRNYKISSPSKLPLESRKFFKNYFARREKLFHDCLKLPKEVFKNKRLLDFGSGTGEHDILYAKWGSKLDLVEINPISVAQTKKYFKFFKLNKNLKRIENKSIFDFRPKNKYDIVVSEGVLHHVNNPYLGLQYLTKNLKKGGFCILQLAFDFSHFQRSLHRYIINYLKNNNSNINVEKICYKLFSETINRANKFGGRSKKQIVYDFYTNPKHKGINLRKLLIWFKKNKIKYYSSYPSIEPEGLINGIHQNVTNEIIMSFPSISLFQSINFLLASADDQVSLKKIIKLSSKNLKIWSNLMLKSKLDDIENKKNINKFNLKKNFNLYFKNLLNIYNVRNQSQIKKIKQFHKEFEILNISLKTQNIKKINKSIKKFEILFKGYNGVPSNYIVGYKI